jgi:hypothetical protein
VTRFVIVAALSAVLAAAAAAPAGASAASCRPVRDLFDGTRYEGSDLFRIRAQGVSCATARRVARAATYKAVGGPPGPTGFKRLRYRRWHLVDDLRGDTDRFSARASGAKRITWSFGEL